MQAIIKNTAKELDREFSQNMRILSKATTANHSLTTYCMSRYIELYIGKKINLELANSLYNVFNIK